MKNLNIAVRTYQMNYVLYFRTIDELINYRFYNLIVWLSIKNITFENKFVFPTILENLYISNCKNCDNNLSVLPNTITSIEIIKSLLVNYNFINKNQYNLESCNLSYNKITQINDVFPKNLISLNLSHNQINLIDDNFFSENLLILNLSFNELTDLSESILNLNYDCSVILMPNKFWFNSYFNENSQLTIMPHKNNINEYYLDIADRFFSYNLSQKIYYLYNITNELQFGIRGTRFTQQPKTIFDDNQNVHNSHIQDSFHSSVQTILDYNTPTMWYIRHNIYCYYNNTYKKYIYSWFWKDKLMTEINKRCKTKTILSRSGVTYKELFYKIWLISEIHPNKDNIREIIKEEVLAGIGYCFTGCVTRLVNSLSGFLDGIKIGYSENEQINNIVITVLKKCEVDNFLNPYDEVKKALNELDIDQDKQKIWLDAL